MPKEHVDLWAEKLAAMKANINGRLVKSDELHMKLEGEMEALFMAMTPVEQQSVERPVQPLLNRDRSLIAHDNQGRLIGFEDLDG